MKSLKEKNFNWTQQENDAFIKGVKQYGKDYGPIAKFIPTKTRSQVKSRAFAIRKAVRRNKIPTLMKDLT